MKDFETQPVKNNEKEVGADAIEEFLRRGYRITLSPRWNLYMNGTHSRILIPVIPVLGSTMKSDYNFSGGSGWYERVEEAGSLKVDITVYGDATCNLRCIAGCLLNIPETRAFVEKICGIGDCGFENVASEKAAQLKKEGLATGITSFHCSSMYDFSVFKLHAAAVADIVGWLDCGLNPARRAFLDCTDFSKEGIRRFCADNMDKYTIETVKPVKRA